MQPRMSLLMIACLVGSITGFSAQDTAWQEESFGLSVPDRPRPGTLREPGTERLGERSLQAREGITLQAEINRHTADEGDWDRVRYSPQAFVLFGQQFYTGLGVGTHYEDREVATSPFFALRTGMSLQLTEVLQLDLHIEFRIRDSSQDRSFSEENPTSQAFHFRGALRIDL